MQVGFDELEALGDPPGRDRRTTPRSAGVRELGRDHLGVPLDLQPRTLAEHARRPPPGFRAGSRPRDRRPRRTAAGRGRAPRGRCTATPPFPARGSARLRASNDRARSRSTNRARDGRASRACWSKRGRSRWSHRNPSNQVGFAPSGDGLNRRGTRRPTRRTVGPDLDLLPDAAGDVRSPASHSSSSARVGKSASTTEPCMSPASSRIAPPSRTCPRLDVRRDPLEVSGAGGGTSVTSPRDRIRRARSR